MLDFAIFAVTFVVILVGAVLYLYPVRILSDKYLLAFKFFFFLNVMSYLARFW